MGRFGRKVLGAILASALAIGGLQGLLTGDTVNADSSITLSGVCHVQDVGDSAGVWDASTGTLTLGTRGQSRRVEAITINLSNNTGLSGTLQYRVHVQDIGWQEYRSAGEMAGTSGQAKRLEGIEMVLTGELANIYSVEYSVHIQDYGDAQGWVSDGALAGTTGESKRLEEVKVRLVPKDSGASTIVNYRVHRQDYGWESVWKTNGQASGTVGEAKRLEGIEIHLSGNQYSGSIRYKTHIQNIGWESSWSKDGEMSGTQGMAYRLEAIKIELTGEIANYYDVYYRVHAEDYGWLGWAKNGEESGTSGLSKRLEAIQIVLVAKDGAAPGNVNGVVSNTNAISVTNSGNVYSNNSSYADAKGLSFSPLGDFSFETSTAWLSSMDQEWLKEMGHTTYEKVVCDANIQISEVNNGNGTKTITAVITVDPYFVYEAISADEEIEVMWGYNSDMVFFDQYTGLCMYRGSTTIDWNGKKYDLTITDTLKHGTEDTPSVDTISVTCPVDYYGAAFLVCGREGQETKNPLFSSSNTLDKFSFAYGYKLFKAE